MSNRLLWPEENVSIRCPRKLARETSSNTRLTAAFISFAGIPDSIANNLRHSSARIIGHVVMQWGTKPMSCSARGESVVDAKSANDMLPD